MKHARNMRQRQRITATSTVDKVISDFDADLMTDEIAGPASEPGNLASIENAHPCIECLAGDPKILDIADAILRSAFVIPDPWDTDAVAFAASELSHEQHQRSPADAPKAGFQSPVACPQHIFDDRCRVGRLQRIAAPREAPQSPSSRFTR